MGITERSMFLTSMKSIILVLVLVLSACKHACPEVAGGKAQTDIITVPAVGHDCTKDICSTQPHGCASCVQLTLRLPPGAWVRKTHCFTTANYPLDNELHEIPCGADVAWSRFDTPIVTASPHAVIVHTVYHNRSSNRVRSVRFQIEWHTDKPLSAP